MTAAQSVALVSAGFSAIGVLVLYFSSYSLETKQSAWFAEALPESNNRVDARNRRRKVWQGVGLAVALLGIAGAAGTAFL